MYKIRLSHRGETHVFKPGEIYSRRTLHQQYGGQPHNRICTPAEQDMILLFANHHDSQNGNGPYTSGWTKFGVFRFIGEGRYGHMAFTRGNRALRDHLTYNKRLHVFVRTGRETPDRVRYEGEFVYRGHFYKEGHDVRNNMRRMIVFVLKPRNVVPASSVPAAER